MGAPVTLKQMPGAHHLKRLAPTDAGTATGPFSAFSSLFYAGATISIPHQSIAPELRDVDINMAAPVTLR